VAFVPFPTAVLASYIQGPSSTIAAAFYCGTYILVNIGYNAMWFTAIQGHLLKPGVTGSHVRKIRRAYLAGFVVYVTATGLALWNAHAGLALSTTLWVFWGVLEYSDEKKSEAPGRSRPQYSHCRIGLPKRRSTFREFK
jgi:hypothetical protein